MQIYSVNLHGFLGMSLDFLGIPRSRLLHVWTQYMVAHDSSSHALLRTTALGNIAIRSKASYTKS